MKLTCAGSLAFTVFATIASAQQGAPTPGPSTAAHQTFVLTGCLETTGPEANRTFQLTNAEPIGQAPSNDAAVKAVGTAGQTLTYRLKPKSALTETGVPDDRLKTFVGQRVRVTVQDEDTPQTPTPSQSPKTLDTQEQEPRIVQLSVADIQQAPGTCR